MTDDPQAADAPKPGWKTVTPSLIHYCDPPERPSYHRSGFGPTLKAGEVWFCGCGGRFVSIGDEWQPVPSDAPVIRMGPRS